MSDNYRDQHEWAASGAIEQVARLQEILAMATEQCDVAVGGILAATGSTEVDSAMNALNAIHRVKNLIEEELFPATHNAVEELERYRGAF